jgi:O-antigen ligase
VVRWHIGPLPTTLLEALIGITVAAYAATLWSEKRLPRARTPLDVPIALFLLAGAIGIVVAPDQLRALGIYRAYFLEAIACFYIAVDLLRTREDVVTFLKIAGTGCCLMAVGQIATFAISVANEPLDVSGAPAFLNTSPNADAMFLEPPFAFAVAFALFPSRPRERWVAAAAAALILAALVTALSRGSFLAIAVLAAVLVLSQQSPRWRLRAVAATAIAGLLMLEIPFVNQRFLSLADSINNRESLWRQTFQMLAHNPILGAGISGYPVLVAPYRPPHQPIHLYPHNIWLSTWSDVGLLGLVAFAVIFFGLLWRGWRALPHTTDINRPVLWGAVGALILYTVHGMFDSPYWKNDLSVEFWLLAALQVVAVRSTTLLSRSDAERLAVPEPHQVVLEKHT